MPHCSLIAILIQIVLCPAFISAQFWKPDNHPKYCYTLPFMWQKLEYIHKNPVRAVIINNAEDYVHSSAADYVFGKQGGKVKVALLDSVQTTNS